MTERHTALLVEDHDDTARHLTAILRALGHDVIHASTQETALAAIARGGYCYALVDLQLPLDAQAIEALVEAGKTVIRTLRKRYPRTNDEGEHGLQIIGMSGHAKEWSDLHATLKARVDDFLRKPFSENRQSIEDTVRECLVNSGRARHADCARVERASIAPEAARGLRNRLRLTITGTTAKKRTRVTVDGRSANLTAISLWVLLKFVQARMDGDDGWVEGDVLDQEGHTRVSRLRKEFEPVLPEGLDLLENDDQKYRLSEVIELEHADWPALVRHSNEAVRKLAIAVQKHK